MRRQRDLDNEGEGEKLRHRGREDNNLSQGGAIETLW
jgi:hypothetical protein